MCCAQVSFLSQGRRDNCVPERGWWGRVGEEVWKDITNVKGELFLEGGIADDFNLIPYAFWCSIRLVLCHEDIFLL